MWFIKNTCSRQFSGFSVENSLFYISYQVVNIYRQNVSLPLDSPFSPPGHLYLLPNPSLLYPTLWISVCSRRWRTLKELITGWICLPPFHFPLLSFWPPLSPASFFSSLYNSMNISERSSCGVHIRKWLLASPLSPLLIPPDLIWVTSNSLLPLLFSM